MMQQCDVPIVHHEESYGIGQGAVVNNGSAIVNSGVSGGVNSMSTNNACSSASGFVSALDLSLYHHEYNRKQLRNYNDTKSHEGFSRMQMPNIVHALNESQEMGMKLVQVLDFEAVGDNPVEDKYRTLQHELLRGLVDPALKPDATERSHLNAIISGTSQHLTREEKGMFTLLKPALFTKLINLTMCFHHRLAMEISLQSCR